MADGNRVGRFFVLTFLISWGFWLPHWLLAPQSELLRVAGTFGPTLAALTLTTREEGRAGLRRLWQRLWRWRVGGGWYLFSFTGTAVVVLAALALYRAGGGSAPLTFNDPAQWYLIIPVFFYVLFFSVLGEEIGWRGYALPRLQKCYGPTSASLIIGLVWVCWHLPLFWTPGNFHQELPFTLFLLQGIALSFLYTWLMNGTGGSLLLPHLFHAASNTTLGVLPVLPMDTGGSLVPLWLTVVLLWVCTLAVWTAYLTRISRPDRVV